MRMCDKSTLTFLRHFFSDARTSVRTGSYAPALLISRISKKRYKNIVTLPVHPRVAMAGISRRFNPSPTMVNIQWKFIKPCSQLGCNLFSLLICSVSFSVVPQGEKNPVLFPPSAPPGNMLEHLKFGCLPESVESVHQLRER